jgi:oligoendopeptidase F
VKPYAVHSEFVPDGLDASKWEQLRPLYEELAGRKLHCVKCLERLILDRSDLDAAAAEASSVLFINMTCRTDDEAANRAYLDHLEHVQPRLKEAAFELDRKIAGSPLAARLPADRYGVYLRAVRVGVELFRAENVAIETEIGRMDQEYAQLCGAMTVVFDGEERTIPQMSVLQEDQDRTVRERGWRAVAERRYQDRERIGEIFDRMVELRHQIARNAGMSDFRDYSFKAKRRFAYTAEDCGRFAEGVRQVCVPALRRLQEERAAALGVDVLRPWDLYVDVKGRPALRPFRTAEEMVERTSRVFHRMDPALGAMFDSLRDGDCLDLETRKGKAPGGYQANRDWIRKPFIFMNAAGIQRDVETMLHEAGHAFHALLSREEPLLAYRAEIPLEFAEVASMGMELAAADFLEEFYPPANGTARSEEAQRARRNHLESIALLLPTVAVVDQFQHWVYTNPRGTRDQRRQRWVELHNSFAGAVSWEGLEEYLMTSWHRILHLFNSPFYYIEYGIAQLGALELWMNFRRDRARTISDYCQALALGGSRPVPELFRAAGLRFQMDVSVIRRLWGEVERELARLPR